MRKRYQFQKSNTPFQYKSDDSQIPLIEETPVSVEYESEERARVSLTDYVLRVGDSVTRDFTIGIVSTGLGFGLLHVAVNPVLISGVYASSYFAFSWGIAKIASSNIKLNLVDQFDQNHSVNSTKWQREGFSADEEVLDEEDPPPTGKTILSIGTNGQTPVSYIVDDLIPENWSWKQFRVACQNIKNSGNFSEPGSKLTKSKFSELRKSFFDYGFDYGVVMVAWRDSGEVRQGLRMSGNCKALIAEMAKMSSLRGG